MMPRQYLLAVYDTVFLLAMMLADLNFGAICSGEDPDKGPSL